MAVKNYTKKDRYWVYIYVYNHQNLISRVRGVYGSSSLKKPQTNHSCDSFVMFCHLGLANLRNE